MGRKSVAVLDVRSSEVCVVVGERGVNRTFVFKASRTEPYDGFDEDGSFFDEKKYGEAIERALTACEQVCGERVRTLYVGVPSAFTELVPKRHEISFPSMRKITPKDMESLFRNGREELNGYRFIRATGMVFVTSDNRRVINPVGISSEKLSGLLSYHYCSEVFAQTTERVLAHLGLSLRFLPSDLAQVNYLIPSETRDEYALFLDVGYLSSSVCIVLGNGVLAKRSFWAGRGQIAMQIMNAFSIPYDGALALLSRANLYRKTPAKTSEFYWKGVTYEIPTEQLHEQIRCGLDGICEEVGKFLEECSGRELEYKPLYVTGDGVCDIRGALEHVSKRLDRICEEVVPDLPYYNHPSASSRIALIDLAYEDMQKRKFIYRLLNGFGG